MRHRLTSTELKRNGTFRKDKHAKHTPAGDLLKELPPPPFPLPPEALEVYEQDGARLIEMRLLKSSDLRTLALYASEMGVYCVSMDAARSEGGYVQELHNGVTAVSHNRRAAESALKNASALADKLGLSPAARARLKGEAAFQDEGAEKPDLIARILAFSGEHAAPGRD